jgi:transcription initiation factor IIE alpha subunit
MAEKTKILKYDFIYAVCKRHICPKCGAVLKVRKSTKSVTHTYTDERRELETVKLVFREFECKKCNSKYSIEEMKQLERNN